MFGAIDDAYFRERGVDIQDVGQRVVARLLGVRHHDQQLTEGAIVVASALLPAHFATLDVEKVAAVVSEHGGRPRTARSSRARSRSRRDGRRGCLPVRAPGRARDRRRRRRPPDPLARRRDVQRLLEGAAARARRGRAPRRARGPPGRDARRPSRSPHANAGLLSDLRLVERHGAEGIGLFRTELLALVHRGFPTEEEQEKLYEQVAAAMKPRPVTIRTLDLGGDKAIPQLETELEANPQLGWRSIRLSLSHLEPFAPSCARSCARARTATCAC